MSQAFQLLQILLLMLLASKPLQLVLLDSLDSHQLSLEDQGGFAWDGTRNTLISVCQIGCDSQLALLADLHPEQAFVPTLDDLALTSCE